VPLFNKQTEEEKEAERQQKEAEKQRRDAAKAEQQRLEAERQAAAAEALRQHLVTLAKYEYKTLAISSTIWGGGGKFNPAALDKELNTQAAQGWRVIEIAMSGKIEKAFSADRNDIYVVFERPRSA
jgi:hypothetical protein